MLTLDHGVFHNSEPKPGTQRVRKCPYCKGKLMPKRVAIYDAALDSGIEGELVCDCNKDHVVCTAVVVDPNVTPTRRQHLFI